MKLHSTSEDFCCPSPGPVRVQLKQKGDDVSKVRRSLAVEDGIVMAVGVGIERLHAPPKYCKSCCIVFVLYSLIVDCNNKLK